MGPHALKRPRRGAWDHVIGAYSIDKRDSNCVIYVHQYNADVNAKVMCKFAIE